MASNRSDRMWRIMQSGVGTRALSSSGAILRNFDNHHDGKFGYVVYRTVYGNDGQWAKFMDRMWEFAAAGFEKDARGSEVEEFFDFDIREDQAQLDGATKNEVRRLFNQWADSVQGDVTMPKYGTPIYVDQEVVDAVLNGDLPRSTEYDDIMQP